MGHRGWTGNDWPMAAAKTWVSEGCPQFQRHEGEWTTADVERAQRAFPDADVAVEGTLMAVTPHGWAATDWGRPGDGGVVLLTEAERLGGSEGGDGGEGGGD